MSMRVESRVRSRHFNHGLPTGIIITTILHSPIYVVEIFNFMIYRCEFHDFFVTVCRYASCHAYVVCLVFIKFTPEQREVKDLCYSIFSRNELCVILPQNVLL